MKGYYYLLGWIFSVLSVCPLAAETASTSLLKAIQLAQQQDPWLTMSRQQQDAITAQSEVVAALPDAKLSLAMRNVPTDSWSTSQDNMTQWVVGVQQNLPRGDVLSLKQQQTKLRATAYPFARSNRKAMVAKAITQLWHQSYVASGTIALIEKERALFEQLVDISVANYASGLTASRQQDIIGAELQVSELDELLLLQQQQLDTALTQLNQWVGAEGVGLLTGGQTSLIEVFQQASQYDYYSIDWQWFEDLQQRLLDDIQRRTIIARHPKIRMAQVQVKAEQTSVNIAEQNYKPEWGISAQYAFREDADDNRSRSDLFSLGVNISVPLFSGQRNDESVRQRQFIASAKETNRRLLMRDMERDLLTALNSLKVLRKRYQLYNETLIPQTQQKAAIFLSAYSNDNERFVEALRAGMAALSSKVEALKLYYQTHKLIADINYYLSGSQYANWSPTVTNSSSFVSPLTSSAVNPKGAQ